ncbi:hypothetical protein FQN50_000643 [Emmonsiellopsis sp. PD_5]|nr:hypothetical protein FQN50_000643 [Emmonsiellopsis sp. PD_5]
MPRLSRSSSTVQPVTYHGLQRLIERSSPRPEPSESELIRFAIKGTVQNPRRTPYSRELDDLLTAQFSKPQLPDWWAILKRPTDAAFTAVDNLDPAFLAQPIEINKFRSLVERYLISSEQGPEFNAKMDILQHTLESLYHSVEADEILVTINALLARLMSLKIDVPKDFLVFCMGSAIRSFSPCALRSYIGLYISAGHGPLEPAQLLHLSKKLTLHCRMRLQECSVAGIASMREVVTGFDAKGSATPGVNLYSLVNLDETLTPNPNPNESVSSVTAYRHYISVLGLMEDKFILPQIWDQVKAELHRRPPDRSTRQLASDYLLALLNSGDDNFALSCASYMTKIVHVNKLFTHEAWERLSERENEILHMIPEQTKNDLLNRQLSFLEARLGLTWDRVRGQHIKSGNIDIWSDYGGEEVQKSNLEFRNIPSADARQLVTAIHMYGCSRSHTDLATLADLLHENDGVVIPLGRGPGGSGSVMEYAWFPECSPIEFSSNPTPSCHTISLPRPPSSLGLIRTVRSFETGVKGPGNQTGYFMQLGSLYQRPQCSPENDSSGETNNPGKWISTGHIICLDRLNGGFTIFYVGKGWGTIDPGVYPHEPHSSLPGIALIGRKSMTKLSLKHNFIDDLVPLNRLHWLDVDPGLFLDP